MVVEAKSYLTAPIEWSLGEDPEYPYEAKFEGHKLLVRLNDFPEEELYALIADGEEITNFDDWPNSWTRPSVSETTSNPHVVDETEGESRILSLFDLYASQTSRYIKHRLEINGCIHASEHSLEVANFIWSKALDLQNLKSFENHETFLSWLYTIAKIHSIAHLKQCTKNPVELEHDDSSEPFSQIRTSEEMVEASERIQQLLIRARSLDKQLFQILDLQLKGFTDTEIGERLGIRRIDVRAICSRKLPLLKALLKETKK